jgi:hypothetical protein
MKIIFIVFSSLTLITTIAIVAYNCEQGPAKQNEGIVELPQPANDSLVKQGKYLVSRANYTDQELNAIAAYLNIR